MKHYKFTLCSSIGQSDLQFQDIFSQMQEALSGFLFRNSNIRTLHWREGDQYRVDFIVCGGRGKIQQAINSVKPTYLKAL